MCRQLKAFWLTGVTFRVWSQVTSSVKLTDWTETGRSFASKVKRGDGHGTSELTLCFILSCLAVIAFSTCFEPVCDPEAKGPKAFGFNGTAGYKHVFEVRECDFTCMLIDVQTRLSGSSVPSVAKLVS